MAVVLFNSELPVLRHEESERAYVRLTVSPPEGLGFLGVLAALVIALVVEVDQSARIAARAERENTPSDVLGIRAVRLRVAQWTSTALGYGAVVCGILVFATSETIFEARAALTLLAGGLVFAFTLLVNLAAESAQALLRELNHQTTRWTHRHVERGLETIPHMKDSTEWRVALADFWEPNSSRRARAAARRLLFTLEGLGRTQSLVVVAGLLVAATLAAAGLFGWRAMIWVGVSGAIWFGLVAMGVVLIAREIFAGARALPALELLFLSIAGLIATVLVWISSGGSTSTGLVDTERWRMLIASAPGLMFAAFALVAAATLMLIANGTFGYGRLSQGVVSGLERRRDVLAADLPEIQQSDRSPHGGDLSVP